jgi:hypothetical protein
MSDNEIELLARLNAHGQAFLSSFGDAANDLKRKKETKVEIEFEEGYSESEDEWGGIVDENASDSEDGSVGTSSI